MYMNDEIQNIINRIEEILQNSRDVSPDMIGSYIVGATIVRDDIEEYYKKYPLLEKIAEQGADLETMGNSKHAEIVLNDIRENFRILKNMVQV